MYTEVRHHARVVADFHTLVAPNPESSNLITTSLLLVLALFCAGVIYPLSFMPLTTDWNPTVSSSAVPAFIFSLRGALLGTVSLLFTAMLATFLVLNIRMKYPQSLLDQLEQYRHVSKYSAYFENRERNARHRKAPEA